MSAQGLPRILVIDDECGRVVDGQNKDRRNLCDHLGLRDVSSDPSRVEDEDDGRPIADAVFTRGQSPIRATLGDFVENDIAAVMVAVRRGWDCRLSGEPRWALVLLDLSFCTGEVTRESHEERPGVAVGRDVDLQPATYFGIEVLARIRSIVPGVPVAILSSQSREQVDPEIDRLGHVGFLSKTASRSRDYLADVLSRHGLYPDPAGQILGQSLGLLTALRDARRLASAEGNVLLLGERGTGKDLVARFLHCNSGRAEKPYVALNSGALPRELFASELFGILRGAATSVEGRDGYIVRADGGYLFMDEVGNIPEQVQGDLLRVLDDKVVTPVGMKTEADRRSVDVRFVFATNADLEGRALAGTFRPDLLDRLRRAGTITLPPLRSRTEDIRPLAFFFLSRAKREIPQCHVESISTDALELLQGQAWQGNVRQLEDCVTQAVSQHRDVRTLYPAQFRHLVEASQLGVSGVEVERRGIPIAETNSSARLGLEALLMSLDGPPGSHGPSMIREGMETLQEAQAKSARAQALLLREALLVKQDEGGKLNFQGAVSLIKGERVTGTTVPDEIKRLLRINEHAIADLLQESPLREAWAYAWSVRPSRRRKRESERGR